MAGGIWGGIEKGVQSFFHPEKGYEDAMQQLQEYFKQAQNGLQPFINNGEGQFGRLNTQANELGDPAALEGKWINSYKESPYATQLTKKATDAGLSAAGTQGLLGSSAALNNVAQSATDIMGSERQNYLNDLMQKYMASVGIGQNLYGVGAATGGIASGNALKTGENMAGLQYGKTNAPGQNFGTAAGGIADFITNLFKNGSPTAKAA